MLSLEGIYNHPSLHAVCALYKAQALRATQLSAHATNARQKPRHVTDSANPRRRAFCVLCKQGAYFSVHAGWLQPTCVIPVHDDVRAFGIDNAIKSLAATSMAAHESCEFLSTWSGACSNASQDS